MTGRGARQRHKAQFLAKQNYWRVASYLPVLAESEDGEKHPINRTGLDNHLELGLPQPPEPTEMPVFPVELSSGPKAEQQDPAMRNDTGRKRRRNSAKAKEYTEVAE